MKYRKQVRNTTPQIYLKTKEKASRNSRKIIKYIKNYEREQVKIM